MKRQIQALEVSYLVHATEDGGKIGAAVASVLGLLGEPRLDEMEGHFGNPIAMISYHVTGEKAQEALAALFSKMDRGMRDRLKDELAEHMDQHSALYLRLDKQRLVEGRLELADSDPVRVRVKPRLRSAKGGAASLFEGLLS